MAKIFLFYEKDSTNLLKFNLPTFSVRDTLESSVKYILAQFALLKWIIKKLKIIVCEYVKFQFQHKPKISSSDFYQMLLRFYFISRSL